MAFTQSSFSTIGAPSTNTPAVYSYNTLDAIAVVEAVGYFDDKKFQLLSGDLIFVYTGGVMYTLQVGSVVTTVSTVTIAPPTNVFITDAETGKQAHVEENGGLAINWQDQHTPMLDLKFLIPDPANFTYLTADTVVGTNTILTNSITGMVIGTSLVLVNVNGQYGICEYLSHTGVASPYTVTVDTPIDQIFPSGLPAGGGSNVIVASSHLNVDGSGTPVIAQISGVGATVGIDIDITRVMGVLSGTTVMNAEKFGAIDILTNGCVLRQVNGTITNIWNVKSNGDLSLLCFDGAYELTAQPTAYSSFSFRNTFAGVAKHGVTVRLQAGDTLEFVIQDDLTLMDDFQMMAQGHLVSDLH